MENSSTRRDFLKTSAAVPLVAGAVATLPSIARAAWAGGSDTIKIGLIGSGGRGTGAASQALNADKGTVLWAVGDTFRDRVDGALKELPPYVAENGPDRCKVPAERQFVGLDSYKQVIDSGVDMVILTSYPNFRSSHIKYALEKGKHIFAEKPVAVDATGIREVLACGEEARKKNLALMVGFCWRYHPAMRAVFQQVLGGTIGDVTSCYTTYLTGHLGKRPRQASWSDLEFQMRNWWHFNWISGDHIVEQAIHSIDRLSWAMGDKPPKSVICLGGRAAREGPESGNVFDHFAATYEYDNGLKCYHSCRQIAGDIPSDNTDYVYGTKGRAVINGWNPASLKCYDYAGKQLWAFGNGKTEDMYQQEHNELFASIRAGKPINDCPRAVNSCLMAIMARMAAYTGKSVTWEQALNSKENLQPPSLSFDMSLPVAPVPVPGKTPLI